MWFPNRAFPLTIVFHGALLISTTVLVHSGHIPSWFAWSLFVGSFSCGALLLCVSPMAFGLALYALAPVSLMSAAVLWGTAFFGPIVPIATTVALGIEGLVLTAK